MTSSKRRHRSGIAWDGVFTVLAGHCDRHGAQHVLKTRTKVGPSPRVILVNPIISSSLTCHCNIYAPNAVFQHDVVLKT